jgi:hypothetical protein
MDSTTLSDRQETVSHIFKEMAEMSLGQFIAELEHPKTLSTDTEYFVKPVKSARTTIKEAIKAELVPEYKEFGYWY